jgi:hypothetical protein
MGSNTEAIALVQGLGTRQPIWQARDRAAHYREQVAHFLRMAEAEAQAGARERLLDLARQYDKLAIRLAAAPES